MARWFSSVFPEDPGLTHGLVPKDPELFSDSTGTRHSQGSCTYMQSKHVYALNKSKRNFKIFKSFAYE